eukprot:3405613-Pleurochrysis_carterae.AAC.3
MAPTRAPPLIRLDTNILTSLTKKDARGVTNAWPTGMRTAAVSDVAKGAARKAQPVGRPQVSGSGTGTGLPVSDLKGFFARQKLKFSSLDRNRAASQTASELPLAAQAEALPEHAAAAPSTSAKECDEPDLRNQLIRENDSASQAGPGRLDVPIAPDPGHGNSCMARKAAEPEVLPAAPVPPKPDRHSQAQIAAAKAMDANVPSQAPPHDPRAPIASSSAPSLASASSDEASQPAGYEQPRNPHATALNTRSAPHTSPAFLQTATSIDKAADAAMCVDAAAVLIQPPTRRRPAATRPATQRRESTRRKSRAAASATIETEADVSPRTNAQTTTATVRTQDAPNADSETPAHTDAVANVAATTHGAAIANIAGTKDHVGLAGADTGDQGAVSMSADLASASSVFATLDADAVDAADVTATEAYSPAATNDTTAVAFTNVTTDAVIHDCTTDAVIDASTTVAVIDVPTIVANDGPVVTSTGVASSTASDASTDVSNAVQNDASAGASTFTATSAKSATTDDAAATVVTAPTAAARTSAQALAHPSSAATETTHAPVAPSNRTQGRAVNTGVPTTVMVMAVAVNAAAIPAATPVAIPVPIAVPIPFALQRVSVHETQPSQRQCMHAFSVGGDGRAVADQLVAVPDKVAAVPDNVSAELV